MKLKKEKATDAKEALDVLCVILSNDDVVELRHRGSLKRHLVKMNEDMFFALDVITEAEYNQLFHNMQDK